jgi:hypothetical protein
MELGQYQDLNLDLLDVLTRCSTIGLYTYW